MQPICLVLPFGQIETINLAYFSQQGKNILTSSNDHITIFWDASTGRTGYT